MRRIQHLIHTSTFRELDKIVTAKYRLEQTHKHQSLKVLSFGCSIGDEIATLNFLMSGAEIFGCEIDPHALKMSKATVGILQRFLIHAVRR